MNDEPLKGGAYESERPSIRDCAGLGSVGGDRETAGGALGPLPRFEEGMFDRALAYDMACLQGDSHEAGRRLRPRQHRPAGPTIAGF
jgi:hypothetical protein